MQDTLIKTEVLSDIMLAAHNLWSWHLNPDLSLFSTNCPNQELFLNALMTSTCGEKLQKHFSEYETPIILNDKLGFVWMAAYYSAGKAYFLMGPAFTSHTSEEFLRSRFDSLGLSLPLSRILTEAIGDIPVLSFYRTVDYAIMLHACVNETSIRREDVKLASDFDHESSSAEQPSAEHSDNWEYEQILVEHIKNGIPLDRARPFTGKAGPMAVNDPLRQAKNELISSTVLCSRAAIAGGLSPDTAYSLSDYYIQLGECCRDINSVATVTAEMVTVYLSRVQQLKKGTQSPVVTGAKEYIENHIFEPIDLTEMAKALGYATYYMSSAFKKDTDVAIRDYIAERKVHYAKQMLLSSENSISDISERLSFSSVSYFCSVFKKNTGVTPMEYRQRKV